MKAKKDRRSIEKEELLQYYILEAHSLDETAFYFHTTQPVISYWLHKYGICKCPLKQKPPKEVLEDYFILQNHSLIDTAKHFGVERTTISRWCKQYGIEKEQALARKLQQQTFLQKYGVKSFISTVEGRTKYERSLEAHYGVRSPLQSPQLQKRKQQTCVERYGVPYYSQREEYRNEIRATKLERYGDSAYNNREKAQRTALQHYGVPWPQQVREIRERGQQTKKQRGTLNTSRPEQSFYEELLEQWGENNVVKAYKDPRYARIDGYQYECDFYIPSEDLFIEFNRHWTHGKHPFDPTNPVDQEQKACWEEKGKSSAYYKIALKVWTDLDPRKRLCAQENGLNYIEIW